MLRAGDDGAEDDEAAGSGRRAHLALLHHHHHHRRGAAVHEGAAGELIWAIIRYMKVMIFYWGLLLIECGTNCLHI